MTQGTDSPRRRLIAAALAERPEEVVETTLGLWSRFAPELTAVVGAGGFMSLYSRSVKLTGGRYPWVLSELSKPTCGDGLSELRACLGHQTPAQAHLASEDLLNVFFDLLASLIGESLTGQILDSAWSSPAPEMPMRNLQNE